MSKRGFLISFEGGEGSGKTTQINRLAESLTKQGHKVVTTREPGGTPEGERVRELIVQRNGGDWNPISEALLIFAARAMLAEHIILPALEDGKIVITDRFTDSTRAYQGYGRGLDMSKIEALNTLVLDALTPDLTFLLDIDVEEGLKRVSRRMATEAMGLEQTEDRFELMDTSFHEKLRAGFLDIAKNNSKRFKVIDAAKDIKTISADILSITKNNLSDLKKG